MDWDLIGQKPESLRRALSRIEEHCPEDASVLAGSAEHQLGYFIDRRDRLKATFGRESLGNVCRLRRQCRTGVRRSQGLFGVPRVSRGVDRLAGSAEHQLGYFIDRQDRSKATFGRESVDSAELVFGVPRGCSALTGEEAHRAFCDYYQNALTRIV